MNSLTEIDLPITVFHFVAVLLQIRPEVVLQKKNMHSCLCHSFVNFCPARDLLFGEWCKSSQFIHKYTPYVFLLRFMYVCKK